MFVSKERVGLGLALRKFLTSCTLEHRKTPIFESDRHCIYHISLCREGKEITQPVFIEV